MLVYRLSNKRHSDSVWSGLGAKFTDGRWNSLGRLMVYSASNMSLAVLEVLVHVRYGSMLAQYDLYSLEVPDELVTTFDKELLSGQPWSTPGDYALTQQFGNEWLESESSVGLIVPSAIVTLENNILLNPQHPEFSRIAESSKRLDLQHTLHINSLSVG